MKIGARCGAQNKFREEFFDPNFTSSVGDFFTKIIFTWKMMRVRNEFFSAD